MKTIGEILKDARVRKKLSVKSLEDIIKIKADFIENIEKENWKALPPFPTVLGFVKSISGALDIDEKTSVAVLKRDYPPQKLAISPKPDIGKKFVWTPKLTFAIGITLTLLAIFGYLIFQYSRFVSPPGLRVDSPREGQEVKTGSLIVSGVTDSDAKVTVNNQPVLVDSGGVFSTGLLVNSETHEVVIKSISRSGKETEIKRTIKVE